MINGNLKKLYPITLETDEYKLLNLTVYFEDTGIYYLQIIILDPYKKQKYIRQKTFYPMEMLLHPKILVNVNKAGARMIKMLANKRINKKDLINLSIAGAIFIFISSISGFFMGLYYAVMVLVIYWIPKALLKYSKINLLKKTDLLNIIISVVTFIFVSNASSFSLGLFYSAIIIGIYWIPKIFLKI